MTVLHADSGTAGDANPIGGSFTTLTGFGALRRVSNTFANAAGSDTDSCAYVNAVADTADVYVQMRVPTVGGGDGGPFVRASTATGAQVFLQNGGGTDFNLYLFNGGYTLLDNDAGTYATNDTVRLEIVGTAYVSKQNSTTRNSVSNGTLSTGRGGMNIYTGATRFDLFEMGDFTSSSSFDVPRNLFNSFAVKRASSY